MATLSIKQIQDGLEQYLKLSMQNVQIDVAERTQDDDGVHFLLHADEGKFEVAIMDEVWDGASCAEELVKLLERDKLSEVMQDLSDFPVAVTKNGCIF
ncbi:MAG: hypothetical protein ACNYNY_06725 [Candidatus Oxydemutatoraceae bacterium WSBS_2016_MAG_OTU14]